MTISTAESALPGIGKQHVPSRYWEDLELGETTLSPERTVTADEIIEFSVKYDPQWFHCDPEAAKASAFGGLIGSGIFSAAIWRLLDHQVNSTVAWVCGLAWENVKWPNPVRPGDVLHATSKCIAKRPSEKRADAGLATLHHELKRRSGEIVMTFDSINFVYRRPV